jgi:hypothetical protein
MTKNALIAIILNLSFYSFSQLGIGTNSPNASLDVVGLPTSSAAKDGIITARLTGDQLKSKIYTVNQKGTLVYVTSAATAPSGQTEQVTALGMYYFTGTIWIPFQLGSNAGQMTYWNGNAWTSITPGAQNQNLGMCYGVPSWGPCTSVFPSNTVNCAGTTQITEVTSLTGRKWMDRNLGAAQLPLATNTVESYGDLYQFGRRSDGHQCRTSGSTALLSEITTPSHGDFIENSGATNNWLSTTATNLWQVTGGANNPCPSGYRVPTEAEFTAEKVSWGATSDATVAFNSILKLTSNGYRQATDASFQSVGSEGYYWTSTLNGTGTMSFVITSGTATVEGPSSRAAGMAVRFIKKIE